MINLERLPGESTAVFLGRVLDALGLHDMAERARAFHFDDYFCPDDIDDGANINRLVAKLTDEARHAQPVRSQDIRIVIDAAINGLFDGTREESDAWAASPDGQETFRDLLGGD